MYVRTTYYITTYKNFIRGEGIRTKMIQEKRLLGLVLEENMCWQVNTNHIGKQAYKRMAILIHSRYNCKT